MHPRVYTAGWFIAVLIISAMGFEFITPHHISTAQSDSSGIVPAIHTNTEITSLSSSRASQTIPCDETALNAAETHFQELKAADPGTVPDADLEAAARDFVARSEPCYRQMITEGNLHIDDGGLWATDYTLPLFYVLFGTKWGISGFGNPGEVVTYSFMPNGVSMSYEAAGTNTAIQSLNGYQSCFLDNIRDAFNAWSAIADIEFMEVVDSNTPANAVGADGDIRIGAHNMGGQFGTIAHAYYPPPNGISIAGDLHFDTSEVWSCTTSGGLDIGLVALHEIGHSIGLGHETTLLAVMNPTYNPSVAVLQTDDINGARVIYGAADVPTPTNTNLVANSNFTSGENNWNFFNIPQHQVDGSNVLNTNANGGNAVWQYTGYDVPGGTPLQASISLNNTDSTGGSKQVKVVLHNNTWTDWMVCDFILPAGNPGLQTHILRGTTIADWDNIGIDIYDYTSNGWAWLQMDNVSVLRLESLDSALPSCQSPAAAQNTNLVLNSVFSSPYLNATDSWGIFGTDSYSVNSGVLNYNATLNSANAVFQLTGKSVPTGSPLELTIDMNNTSTGNKLIGVVIHDHTFSEYFSCVFLVPGDNPGLHTYTVRNTTTRQWGNVWVDIYDWTRNGQGFVQIDNVSLQWRPGLDTSLHCQSPTAPVNTNIVRNGTFNSSDTEWTFYNVSDRNVSGGVLNANASPGGNAIYQPFGYSFPINAPIEATFDLNVSASGSKNIRAVVHDELWGEYFVCVFTIPGGNPGLQTYSIRGRTTRIWGHAYIDIYDDTANGQPHLQYDNISVQHNTGINPTGTECTSSGSMIAFDLPLIRVEAESSIPEQQGNWTQYPSDAASGGAYIYSSGTSDDTLTLHFTGTQINIMYVLHPSLGTMAVEIDGITVETLDLAAAQNFGESLLIDNLSTGGHTLRVYAQNGIIAVDTFEIPGG